MSRIEALQSRLDDDSMDGADTADLEGSVADEQCSLARCAVCRTLEDVTEMFICPECGREICENVDCLILHEERGCDAN